jgi:hypothetical protein
MNDAVGRRDFTQSAVYQEMAICANEYERAIEEMICGLELEEVEISEETEEETEKWSIPNYSDYVVDSQVEHTLYENFIHKRPAGFKVNGRQTIEVRTWQGMLLRTCELLMETDEEKFMSFQEIDEMNGKKIKYFSIDPAGMTKPRKVNGKIYVEINQSGNGVRNMIIKMLKRYGYKISEFKVYCRADYSAIDR